MEPAGTSRLQETPVADPDLIRRLDVGQTAYIYRGGVTFIQVKRLVAGPAALPGRPRSRPVPLPAPHPATARPGLTRSRPAACRAPRGQPPGLLADISALLDEAFGPGPGGPR